MVIHHPYIKGEMMTITGGQGFILFIFATGLFALSGSVGSFDLMALRLLSIEIFILIGLYLLNGKTVWNFTGLVYLLYLLWIIYGITYSNVPIFGLRVLLKYSYPFMIMLFASKVMDDDDLFIKIAFLVRKIGLIVIFISFIVPFILLLFPGVLWYGTALAIHFICLMVLSMAIFDVRRNKWDMIIAVVFFIPCFLWVFRTSILGSIVALTIFSIIRYRVRSLPYLLIIAAIFISLVLFSPTVKKKMFYKNIDTEKVLNSEGIGISKDDIDSNGRFAMWDWSLKKYYQDNQLTGSGSGTLQNVFYQKRAAGGAGIVHNDYVQILCDSGLIGLILYLGIFLSLLVHSFIVYNHKSNSDAIRICAIAAGASAIGMAATSYTDNTVNYTMATLSYPFGLYGMMLGLLKAQTDRQSEEIEEIE